MTNTYTQYQLFAQNMDRSVATTKAQPQIARETEYYQANIENVKSIEDFLNDDRLFAYAMKAHGLEDMTYAKAFMKKALVEGVSNTDSFANLLTDQRYKAFVETFNFESLGEFTTGFQAVKTGVVNDYVRQSMENDVGAESEGARLALYFERKAPQITSTIEILADQALSKVVRSALGIPEATAVLDIDRQVALIEEKLDIEDFQSSEKIAKFLEDFTVRWDASGQGGGTQSSDTVGLLYSSSSSYGISGDLLLSVQQSRR